MENIGSSTTVNVNGREYKLKAPVDNLYRSSEEKKLELWSDIECYNDPENPKKLIERIQTIENAIKEHQYHPWDTTLRIGMAVSATFYGYGVIRLGVMAFNYAAKQLPSIV